MSMSNSRVSRSQKSKGFQAERPNWIIIAGSALLSTLTIRLGYKLKLALDTKKQANANRNSKGNCTYGRRTAGCHLHSNMYSFPEDNDDCFNCISGTESMVEKQQSNGEMLSESNVPLSLVKVPAPEFNRENGIIWASSPDHLELPPKPFHQSNCSDSPCVSESGSDIFTKREVIQKLRQQLKRRDDMIVEMQDQIMDLQNSLNAQLAHSSHLQSQLDASNRDLFDSEREIQRLRKAIADHCVRHLGSSEKILSGTDWPSELRSGYANGYVDGDNNFESAEKGSRGDGERIEMLKKEVGDLKEVIEGKEYLLQNYKEQKVELSSKIKELQQKLDSHVPNIL